MATNSLKNILSPINVGDEPEREGYRNGELDLAALQPRLSHPKLRLSPSIGERQALHSLLKF